MMLVLNGKRTVVSTLAGGTNGAYADGSGTNVGFNLPLGVAVDASGNVFVADYGNQRIRKVTAGGGTRIGSVTLRARCTDIDVDALVFCTLSLLFVARVLLDLLYFFKISCALCKHFRVARL